MLGLFFLDASIVSEVFNVSEDMGIVEFFLYADPFPTRLLLFTPSIVLLLEIRIPSF